MDFFNHLNYSLGNEDWRVEEEALQIKPGQHVVCVTASGDRPLHLLMTDCASIASIDFSPAQNFLLDLKVAAISQLDYETWTAFSGCEPCNHRYDIFKKLKPHLHSQTACFWEENKKMIIKGVIYQGRVERLTRLSAFVANLVRHKKISRLFAFNNIGEQREFVASQWDTWLWRKFFEVMLNPGVSRCLLNDPGLNTYTDDTAQPGKYIHQKMLRYLNTHLASKSPLLQLILLGRLLPEARFPYLTHEGYIRIRRDMHRLRWITGNIVDFLSKATDNFDCFSLSDIASYMSQETFEKLLHGLKRSAGPMARFCLREFISRRVIPEDLKWTFKRDVHLEQKLEQAESNFVYRFMVGNICE